MLWLPKFLHDQGEALERSAADWLKNFEPRCGAYAALRRRTW